MRKTISTVLTRVTGQPEVLYECRNCGANLDPGATVCAECGASDIAVYEFPSAE